MKALKFSLAILPILFSAIFILSGCMPDTEQHPSLENGKIKLVFNRETGGLISLRDLTNENEFLKDTFPAYSPWEIDIVHSLQVDTISVFAASRFRFSKPDPSTLVLEWSKFKGSRYVNLKVTARIALEMDKPFSTWKIQVEGVEGKQISRMVFPRISGLKASEDQCLAVPVWTGRLIRNPLAELTKIRAKEKKFEWSYPGLMSLQCMSLYNSGQSGFYASCNDSLAYSKDFTFALDRYDRMVYQVSNYPSLDAERDKYSTPYETVIGTFKGDWTTAALIYREWGSKQKWCRESRMKKGLTPGWLEKTALWEWNRGKSGNVLEPAEDLKQRLGLPVNVFWHWWHGCSYDDGFPEYMPPREGKDSFISAMTNAKNSGIRAIVYMNQALWGTTTKSWKNENAVLASAKDANGNTISHVFNKFTNKSAAYMCMGTQFWKDKYSSLCDSAVNTYKVNGVYMDMACLSLKCYDKSHGHQVGGGNYWLENFSRITNQIRSSVNQDKELVLAGEGCGEVWLPYLDAFLTLEMSKERYAGTGGWETIPFFQAVYHQFSITYGNYSSLTEPPYDELWPKEYAPAEPLKLLDKKFNKQFLMEQARSFVWGIQPTIANYKPNLAHERKEEIQYLLNLAKIRNQGLQYLLYGKFLKSPDIASPVEEFDISRLSIYAGKTGNTVTKFRDSFPLIYSGMWQSEGNQIGIAVASISDKPFRVDFTLNANDYELSPAGTIYRIDEGGRELMGTYTDRKIVVDFTLHPRGLCILEIIPDKP
jgi:hypothetical protein